MKPLREKISKIVSSILGLNYRDVHLEIPETESFADYSTNLAFRLKTKMNKKLVKGETKETAENIVKKLLEAKPLLEIVEKIEVGGRGFINFWVRKEVLFDYLNEIIKQGESFGNSKILAGKKYLIEHTSPNTIKTLHIGHVRNNVLGMAVHNLLEACGAEVKLDAINNDRGIHVMKAVWAYKKFGEGKTPKDTGEKPDHFVDRFYLIGAKAYEEDEKAKQEMHEMLKKWELGDEDIRAVWKKLRDWTFVGFLKTYQRLGSYHDVQWFESDFYEKAKELVEEGLRRKVFRRLPDGAVLSDLKGYGLPDTIVLRSDGTSLYHTQDLYLTKLKREKFPCDLYIWDIGPEQTLYLKQLFAMCEQLGIGKREDYFHLSYGLVFLKGKGKMSSRKGTVVSADWLIDEMVKKAKDIIEKSQTGRGLGEKEKEDVAESIGIGAIKYGFLNLARETDLHFDMDESLSLEGNSGVYLQYTYARTQSVLQKFRSLYTGQEDKLSFSNFKDVSLASFEDFDLKVSDLNLEELGLLRSLIHFPEIIEDSAINFSPNLLCNYLYNLARKFNLFYQKHRILPKISLKVEEKTSDEKTEKLRIALTYAVGVMVNKGLTILGIKTPTRI